MTTQTQELTWRFGGWLSDQPPQIAWSVLGAVACVGAVLTVWSYRSALASISPLRRVTLGALRLTVWITLLVILAAPTRVVRTFEAPASDLRPMAVLADWSGSMTKPDNRQRRRIDDALLRWRDLEPVARRSASRVNRFVFAEDLGGANGLDSPPPFGTAETRLFSSLDRLLAEAPAGGWSGIVTLTDGLDTTALVPAEAIERTTRAALVAKAPLYFVPGRNRYTGGAYFTLREFSAPATTAPRSVFRVEVAYDSNQATAQTVPLELKVNGVSRPSTPLSLAAGRRLATWSTDLQADAPGLMELEVRIGEEVARTTVRVEAPPANRILYFQGALDWGYRFLADIMKRDAAFVLTPVFNFPNANALLPPGALSKMPATADELAGFDVIVLANASAAQFSGEQQKLLSSWVRDGGVLLFLTPDDDSSQGFAGSEMEKMLPVIFQPPQAGSRGKASTGVLARLRERSSNTMGGTSDTPVLTPYAWEDTPRVREIFADATKSDGAASTPVFSAFAHVARAKPGAEVLARHPDETVSGTGEHAILLALQRYGRGQSAVLTTDALWRWKLNQPSTARGAELFWQNLFAWLGRDRQHGLRFNRPPLHAQFGRPITLVLEGSAEKLNVTAAVGEQHVSLSEGPADGAKRNFQWTPSGPGFWQITASDATGRVAKHWIRVGDAAVTGELSGLPPNEELLRVLASRTGGSVLETEAPLEWRGTRASPQLLAERREALWHREWVFGVLLGLYGLELLLRRRWHLL